MSVLEALEGCDVAVVCGAGGVGKTTVAASLGVALARSGRRVCVLTVDPARRLAGALGLEDAGDAASEVDGDWPGALHAVQLHAESTFDALVDRHAQSEAQAAAIKRNPVYRSLASALGGTQEYMAMERLYDLHHAGGYDVVVVDTPPTRSAIELLDAPDRLLRFLSNRVVRSLLAPTRLSLRAASAATASVLRLFSAVVGSELVADAVAFFHAFAGMQEGFAERAEVVKQLLGDQRTAFVLVSSPSRDALDELEWFDAHLASRGIAPRAIVLNRCHPSFVADPAALQGLHVPDGEPWRATVGALLTAQAAARHDAAQVEALSARHPNVAVGAVPLSAAPARDVTELVALAAALA